MTFATCFKCGNLKLGALSPCRACGAHPTSGGDMALSLTLTDRYLSEAEQARCADAIRSRRDAPLDERSPEAPRRTPADRAIAQTPRGFAPPPRDDAACLSGWRRVVAMLRGSGR